MISLAIWKIYLFIYLFIFLFIFVLDIGTTVDGREEVNCL